MAQKEEKYSFETNTETLELPKLETHLVNRTILKTQTEVDSIRAGANYSFHYYDICSSLISIIFRSYAVYSNGKLAYDYYLRDELNYFVWTSLCMTIPLGITSSIHFYMCYEDGKFKNGFLQSIQTVFLVLLSSVIFRYGSSLYLAVKCKCAELKGDRDTQIRIYKLTIREECDVAFLRLFECFLESAPQKILQISIVLTQTENANILQISVICVHFASMAWCLAAYHRYVRFAQEDKFNISLNGLVCLLCWHFSISVSRSICISFVASIFPLWILILCLCHAMLFGILIFIIDRPKCPDNTFLNFIFCQLFGIIYLFTFISTTDEPTKNKYIVYYTICFLENVCCILTLLLCNEMVTSLLFIYLLCIAAIAFYIIGIIIMITYYMRYHPKITARYSKRLMINST